MTNMHINPSFTYLKVTSSDEWRCKPLRTCNVESGSREEHGPLRIRVVRIGLQEDKDLLW